MTDHAGDGAGQTEVTDRSAVRRWSAGLVAGTVLLAACASSGVSVSSVPPSALGSGTTIPSLTPTPMVSSTPTPSSGPWTAAARMSAYFFGHSATLLTDGRVLVAGGDPPIAELYDSTTDSWTRTGDMLQLREGHTATLLLDGRVLVAGDSYSETRSAELYDPDTGTWSATGSMVEARYEHTATLLLDGRVLVAGGHDERSLPPYTEPANIFASAELYDPATGTWSATGRMTERRFDHTATLLSDGRVLVAGGIDRGEDAAVDPVASAELYDPATGTWSATGSMTEPRFDHTATLLSDGRVLVAGGFSHPDENSYLPASEAAALYDPATGSWTVTGMMLGTRADHAATLLVDGRVLVVGVWADVDPALSSSAEVYDPDSGSWTATRRRRADCVAPTATLLPDGRVLVVGGYTLTDLCSTELYDPAGA
jgi:N-acetylneuraminic acid mutarotase